MPVPDSDPLPIDYKAAGVDLDAYDETMRRLPPLMTRTFTPNVLKWPDGFAGLFRLQNHVGLFNRTYRDPVLVASTDVPLKGVATELLVPTKVVLSGCLGCFRRGTRSRGRDLRMMSQPRRSRD